MSDVEAPITAVRDAVARALAEDLGPLGDLTAVLVPEGTQAKAAFVPRSAGVVSGRACVVETFAQVDPAVQVEWSVEDGEEIEAGQVLGTVEGPLPSILTGERTALNLLCHLSGIASLTRRYVRATHGNARIRDTRKTTPGLRVLEKYAVRCGGGSGYRMGLSDAAMVKDNHVVAAGGVVPAFRAVRETFPEVPVEVECDSVEQVVAAIEAGADLLLLDNMTTEQLRECVRVADGRARLEASGGMTLDRAREVAETGVDHISVGALTHSAPVLDLGFDLRAKEA